MVEVKESTYDEALLRQLHLIWSLLKVFTDSQIHIVFLTFIVDLTFGKMLNTGLEES